MGLPKRWKMVLLMNSGILIEYCLRVNISVAVIQMASVFGWSEHEKGLMLSAFYWGYTLGQIPSNFLVFYYGAKHVLGLSVLLSSVLTLLIPAACETSFTVGLFVRALVGLAASATFPACFHFFPIWIPKSEKTLLVTAVMSGIYLGEIVCFSISGVLVTSTFEVGSWEAGGWPAAFWSFGLLGILWYPLWINNAYERPTDHPTISDDELHLILRDEENTMPRRGNGVKEGSNAMEEVETELQCALQSEQRVLSERQPLIPAVTTGASYLKYQQNTGTIRIMDSDDAAPSPSTPRSEVARRIPWAAFFRSRIALTLLFAYWTNNWIAYMMLSEIPSYLTDVLHFSLKDAGIYSMMPYFAQFIATVFFGQMFYYMQHAFGWKTRTVRQVAQFVSFVGSSTCLLLCGFISDANTAFACMVLGLGLYGASQSGIACAFLDVSPNYSSTLNTIANVFGSIAGIASPLVVSVFTTAYPGIWGWRYVFILTALQCVVALILWAVYQTSDVVPLLNTPRPKKTVAYKEWCPWFRY